HGAQPARRLAVLDCRRPQGRVQLRGVGPASALGGARPLSDDPDLVPCARRGRLRDRRFRCGWTGRTDLLLRLEREQPVRRAPKHSRLALFAGLLLAVAAVSPSLAAGGPGRAARAKGVSLAPLFDTN